VPRINLTFARLVGKGGGARGGGWEHSIISDKRKMCSPGQISNSNQDKSGWTRINHVNEDGTAGGKEKEKKNTVGKEGAPTPKNEMTFVLKNIP